MKVVIFMTLWQRRWSTVWWSLGAAALILLNMVFYPTFKDQAAELEESLAAMPEAAIQLFGGSTDFFSPVGFLNSQIFFMMLPMILAILAIGIGASLIGREEQNQTLEILLARPISRSKLLIAKAIAGISLVSIVTLISLVIIIATARAVDIDVSARSIILATFMCWLFTLASAAVAFVLAASGKSRGLAIALASAVALTGYVVSSLSQTVDWLKIPAKFLPFHYYRPEAILKTGNVEVSHVGILLAAIIVLGAISWLVFRGRDIKS